jgi:CheY-like chemotaxis protein
MAKILVIDDDEGNREILRARLEQAGHEVTEAKDGEEGLRLSQSLLPSLIFLDLMMPSIDGWQICRQLKANPKTRAIPVIILTACSKDIEQLRGWESGADDYVTKPWDPAGLLELVRKYIPAFQDKNPVEGVKP